MLKLRVAILLLLCTKTAVAQVTDRFPVRFGQYYQEKTMVNPASANATCDFDGNVGYLSFFGTFSDVRTFYGSTHYNLNRKKKGIKNSIGALLYGDREGAVLNRSRAYINYAVHIPINENTFIAAGTYMGFVSFSTQSTEKTAGASDAAPDGTIGLWAHTSNMYAGISVNQLFNLTLKPLEQEFLLQRHVNVLGGYTIKGVEHSFLTHVNLRLTKDFVFDIGEVAKIYNQFLVGFSYRHKEGIQLSAGIEQLELGNGQMAMQFSYQFPFTRNERANIQSYEITLNFLVD